MQKTAAGNVSVINSAFSSVRGGTRLFLGTLEDGRYVVASRFQIEIRTSDKAKADSRFKELCDAA